MDALELMDDPGADLELLLKTIRQFSFINATIGGAARRVERWFFPLMKEDREYVVVDIGSGGCDIPVALVAAARRRCIALRVIAVDRDERILPVAREATKNFPEIETRLGDARDLASLGPVDVVTANHLLHHLDRSTIGDLLVAARRIARLGFVFDDLLRSRWSWIGYSIFASVFARRSFAFDDGRLSILRGFRPGELASIARERQPTSGIGIFRSAPGRVGYLWRSGAAPIGSSPNPF